MEFNMYCDESNHLYEKSNGDYMIIGTVYCPKDKVKKINKYIRDIKEDSCLIKKDEEMKWNKISKSNFEIYEKIIEYFFYEDDLKFRAIIVDKKKLDHKKYKNNADEFYHISYYNMLKYVITPQNAYNIFPDIKDTNSYHNHKKVLHFLRKEYSDEYGKTVRSINPIRSKSSEIIQITDILIGALSYYYRKLGSSKSKEFLIKKITENVPYSLEKNTSYDQLKFSIFLWEPKNGSI